SLAASLGSELLRDNQNVHLRQIATHLHGALRTFNKTLALSVDAKTHAHDHARSITTPQFSYADIPTLLDAISNISNINCLIYETQNSAAPKGNMDRALVKAIIDQCKARGIQTISLHHVNEPLLHPSIFEILKYLEDNGMSAVISTNANEMRSVLRRLARQNILPAQLSLRYSIDAGTAATYNEIRRGGDFATVLGGIAPMAQFCSERNIALPTRSNYGITRKANYG